MWSFRLNDIDPTVMNKIAVNRPKQSIFLVIKVVAEKVLRFLTCLS